MIQIVKVQWTMILIDKGKTIDWMTSIGIKLQMRSVVFKIIKRLQKLLFQNETLDLFM